MPVSKEASLLVIVAHPDDECLGAGGTIRLHSSQDIPVDVLCLTGNATRNTELDLACETLGVRRTYTNTRDDFAIDLSLTSEVVDVILQSRPEVVITHSSDDYNRNHVMVSRIVDEAIEWAAHVTMYENAHRVSKLYHMEVNSLLARPSVMVDVSDSYKLAIHALSHHQSQMAKADGFYARFYDARTRLRGVQAACERAEAFNLRSPTHAGPFYPENHVRHLF